VASRYEELTHRLIETTKPPVSGQDFIRDTLQPGLAVRILPSGVRSFILEVWVTDRSRRTTLGKLPALSLKDARKLAKQQGGQFAAGVDLVAERKDARAKAITLGAVFEDYLDSRELRPTTLRDYRAILKNDLGDWQNKPVTAITRDMVERRHKAITDRSPAMANLVSRLLRALFNFAAGKYEDGQGHAILTDNPVKRLSATRQWNRIERRRSFIKPHELKAWFLAVEALPNVTHRDYLWFLLFTGLRKEEAAQLTWRQVDLTGQTFTLPTTKNHQPHTLPLRIWLKITSRN